uniref:lipocalin family protein n=1 Tax=Ningiella ruwaisensis TaxID=2364274 RepID=UPI0010A06965|nr:lipocalin family protein [Ningiella ruwaisensis]
MQQGKNAVSTGIIFALSLFLFSCTSVPEGVQPVSGFDKSRYLGTWYEIARLDHSFERGLEQVTASYSLREDGGITVINKGFNVEEGEWTSAEGKAYFVESENIGHLKVSFFGPFYSSYVIANLDKENYDYALITGYNKEYLWILSRTPELEQGIVERLVEQAKGYGFATDELIYVDHSPNNAEL